MQSGCRNLCESISVAFMQMKVTTSPPERQKQRPPPKKERVCRWYSQTTLSLMTDFSPILLFASVPATNGSMRQYLQPILLAQVIRLLQNGAFTKED